MKSEAFCPWGYHERALRGNGALARVWELTAVLRNHLQEGLFLVFSLGVGQIGRLHQRHPALRDIVELELRVLEGPEPGEMQR